jgi:hypothetical protein
VFRENDKRFGCFFLDVGEEIFFGINCWFRRRHMNNYINQCLNIKIDLLKTYKIHKIKG